MIAGFYRGRISPVIMIMDKVDALQIIVEAFSPSQETQAGLRLQAPSHDLDINVNVKVISRHTPPPKTKPIFTRLTCSTTTSSN